MSLWVIIFALAAVAVLGCSPGYEAPAIQSEAPDYTAARARMVREQLAVRGRDIRDPKVLAAMETVPRHAFVPEKLRHLAYEDYPLPIGHDQTISQPYIVAFMTEQMALQPTDRILEIGTGSGYQAAILAQLVTQVCSIEIVEPLAQRAEATLTRLGYKNVKVKAGDGYQGWHEEAPFDAIMVTCAPDHVPQPLIDQLKEGGRLIIPVGDRGEQYLFLLEKKDGKVRQHTVLPVRFVPMTGALRPAPPTTEEQTP